jgi:hypothetical protein
MTGCVLSSGVSHNYAVSTVTIAIDGHSWPPFGVAYGAAAIISSGAHMRML